MTCPSEMKTGVLQMNHQVTDYPDQILRPQLAAYGANAAFTERHCTNTNGISPRHRNFLLDIREMLLQEGL